METMNTNTEEQQEIEDVLDRVHALLQDAYDLLFELETNGCSEDFEYALECATEAVDEAQQRLCDASESLEMLDEDENEED